jgi:DNA-binding transcriptional MerR regulator
MDSLLASERRNAPFTLEDLAAAANRVLREYEHRPVGTRTVRYYISEGILPKPMGSDRHARYSFEHLLRIVGARALQDSGLRLEAIRETLNNIPFGGEEQLATKVEHWLEEPASGIAHLTMPAPVRERRAPMAAPMSAPDLSSDYYSGHHERSREEDLTRAFPFRIPLTGGAILLAQSSRAAELRDAHEALGKFIEALEKHLDS